MRGAALSETKADLFKSKSRIARVQTASNQLKKKAEDAGKRQEALLEAERKRIEEAADRKKAAEMIQEYTDA